MNAQRARNILQAILDEFVEDAHGWVEEENGQKYLGVWVEAKEGEELELWPWTGAYQPYAPCFIQSNQWGTRGSWGQALREVRGFFIHWKRYLERDMGFMGFHAKKSRGPVFVGGKLVDPE